MFERDDSSKAPEGRLFRRPARVASRRLSAACHEDDPRQSQIVVTQHRLDHPERAAAGMPLRRRDGVEIAIGCGGRVEAPEMRDTGDSESRDEAGAGSTE